MMLGISILLSAAMAGGTPVVPKAPPVVTVHAKDFTFTAPKSIKSGATTFRLVNDGKQLHHLTLIRLDKGKTMADFAEAMKKPGPPPAWTTDVGGPNAVLPGARVDATLTLDAGEYVMLCFIPSPGETMPHAMKGMMSPLTVTAAKSDGVMPTADMTVNLSDYKFTLSKPFTAGHHVVDVVNDASQSHELVIIALPPGKSIADVSSWVDKDLMKGAPPGKPIGGITGLAKGRSATMPIDLKPGRYGLICFAPDAKDGKSHSLHGMVQEFTVAAK